MNALLTAIVVGVSGPALVVTRSCNDRHLDGEEGTPLDKRTLSPTEAQAFADLFE